MDRVFRPIGFTNSCNRWVKRRDPSYNFANIIVRQAISTSLHRNGKNCILDADLYPQVRQKVQELYRDFIYCFVFESRKHEIQGIPRNF